MTAKSYYRGHEMWFDDLDNLWRYWDDNSIVRDNHQKRSCGHCGQKTTKEGHDPCIANLPDVRNACCGHGDDNAAYIQFNDLTVLHGVEARNKQKDLVMIDNKWADKQAVFVNSETPPDEKIPTNHYMYTEIWDQIYFCRLYECFYNRIIDDEVVAKHQVLEWHSVKVKKHCRQALKNMIDGQKSYEEWLE